MEIIATSRLEESPGPRCPACGDPPYISFNWPRALDGSEESTSAVAARLGRIRPLKYGYLHQCSVCAQYWVLDDSENRIERVLREREEILFEWDRVGLEIAGEHLQVLQEIGGTGQDHYGNGRDRIEIPCAVELEDGTLFDPAVVWVTRRPPIVDYLSKVALWQKVKSVQPTEFALPLDVRMRTLQADELRMGFAPTLVSTVLGESLVLNWSPCLLHHREIKGKDIRLVDSPTRARRPARAENSSMPTIIDSTLDIETIHFFVDWFSGAHTLIKVPRVPWFYR